MIHAGVEAIENLKNAMGNKTGGATDISMQGIAASVAENIDRIAKGEVPINLVFI